ncbi:MAG: hypothetical protein WC989_04360 [Micavibrio sp.]
MAGRFFTRPLSIYNQSGSALVFILIAVALFAALSYAMMRDGGTGAATRTMSDAQLRLAAAEIISYGDAIAHAVQRMRINGCSDREIDFSDHGGVAKNTAGEPVPYNNPYRREDGSCGIFHPNGGKITPRLIDEKYASDPALVNPTWSHPQSLWLSAMGVKGVGTEGPDGTDLVLYAGRLRKDVCLTINDMLRVSNPSGSPPHEGGYCLGGGHKFEGEYPACGNNPIGYSESALVGKRAGCRRSGNASSGAEQYSFYRVLIAR